MSALREAAQQALEALLNSRPLATEDDFAIKVRKHSETITALRAALAQQADRMRAKWEAVGAAVEGADRDSRGMFVARLENMQKHGDHWLTVQAVLALLNDCDMLAARERA